MRDNFITSKSRKIKNLAYVLAQVQLRPRLKVFIFPPKKVYIAFVMSVIKRESAVDTFIFEVLYSNYVKGNIPY